MERENIPSNIIVDKTAVVKDGASSSSQAKTSFSVNIQGYLNQNDYSFIESFKGNNNTIIEKWKNNTENKDYVFKSLKKYFEKDKIIYPVNQELILREATIINYINTSPCNEIHEQYILKYEIIQDPNFIILKSEALSESLFELVKSYKIEEPTDDSFGFFINLIYQLLSGFLCLEQKGIIHGDVKLENIFFDSNTKKIKIADFGGSAIFNSSNDRLKYVTTSSKFMLSPSFLRDHQQNRSFRSYSIKEDCYSLGLIIFELLLLLLPISNRDNIFNNFFNLDHNMYMFKNKKTQKMNLFNNESWRKLLDYVYKNINLSSDDKKPVLNLFVRIALSLLQDNPNRRPNISVIMNHIEDSKKKLQSRKKSDE